MNIGIHCPKRRLMAVTLAIFTVSGSATPLVAAKPIGLTAVTRPNRQLYHTETLVDFTPQNVTFASSEVGYLCGEYSKGNKNVARVYKTVDGGQSWTLVFHRPGVISNVAQFTRHIWVDVTDFSTGSHGVLYLSSDWGREFVRLGSLPLQSLDFTSNSRGWAIFSSNPLRDQVVQTRDGGKHWHIMNLSEHLRKQLGPTGNPTWISFSDSKNGYLLETSEPGAGEQGKVLLRTTNEGKTWTDVFSTNVEPPASKQPLNLGGYANGISVVPNHPSSLYLWETRGPFVYTESGGATWNRASFPWLINAQATGVSMHNTLEGFALFQGQSRTFVSTVLLGRTQDGGKNWTVIHTWKPYSHT